VTTIEATETRPVKVQQDLRTLATFIQIFCKGKKHPGRELVALKGFDTSDLSRKPLHLCPACTKLLHHAIIKRTHCPYDPKPQCKDCTTHCYSKAYRAQIREVMRYSGWRLLLTGRVDYLYHLIRRPHNSHGNAGSTSQKQESPLVPPAGRAPLVQIRLQNAGRAAE
jgi:hypothetical protein